MNRLPRALAAGLQVRLEANVVRIEPPCEHSGEQRWRLHLSSGDSIGARILALTIPAPSAVALLQQASSLPREVREVLPLVGLIRMVPCLTVMARYGEDISPPAWDVSYPRDSRAVQSLTHDSRKRPAGTPFTLVIQARPAFSRAHQDDAPDTWAALLLAAAAEVHGPWAARPASYVAHRWRKARVDPGTELTQPVAVRVQAAAGSPALLGFAGDGFHRAGGVEGAYLSGQLLAQRLTTVDSRGDDRGSDRRRD